MNALRAVASRSLRQTAVRTGPKFLANSVLREQAPFAAQVPLHRKFATGEKVNFTFIDGDGDAFEVSAQEGDLLADVAHDNDIELECACGHELACSTCHLIFEEDVFEKLPEISEEEEDMLDLAWGLTDTSRLGCQIEVTEAFEGTTVRIPDESNNLM